MLERWKTTIQERRNLIVLVVLVMMLFLLIAFFISRTATTRTPGTGNQTGGTITLQWWGVFLEPEVVQPLINEYQAANPNVKIQYANKWPGGNRELATKLYQDELNRILKESNQSALPDIFMVENTWAGYYERHTAAAPASVITPQTVASSFYPAVSQNFVSNNQVKGLPLWMDSLAIIYNRDHLTQAGVSVPDTNWIDFRTLAARLTNRSGGTVRSGFAMGTTKNTSFAQEVYNLLLLQNGVNIATAAGKPQFAANLEGSKTALDFLKSFTSGSGSWDSSQKTDALAFLEGRVSMIVGPSWRLHDLLALNRKNNLKLNIGVAAIPQLQGQNIPTINWASYWGNMVSSNRPNSAEAWKFLNWITQPAQLRKLRTAHAGKQDFFSFIYPRSDMATDLQADPYLRVYNAAMPTAQSWYMVNGYAVRAAFAELIESAGGQSNIQNAQSKIDQITTTKL
jgi:multiple sugar transport system substrate-binding protein